MIMVLYGTPSHDHADHFAVRRLLGSLHRTRGRGRGIEQPAAPIHFLPHCIQRYRRQGGSEVCRSNTAAESLMRSPCVDTGMYETLIEPRVFCPARPPLSCGSRAGTTRRAVEGQGRGRKY